MPEKRYEIGKYMLVSMVSLIAIVGLSGFITPAPTKWHWPDCEWEKGVIMGKGKEEISCFNDYCYTEYYLVVDYDDEENNTQNETVWVSPLTYLSTNEGDIYNFPIC